MNEAIVYNGGTETIRRPRQIVCHTGNYYEQPHWRHLGRVGQAAQYRTRESVATILREPDLRRPPRQVHGAVPLWGICMWRKRVEGEGR